jgi:hypothetical protein
VKLYLAGGEQQSHAFDALARASGATRFLKSFAYFASRKSANYLIDTKRTELDIFVDSGAFTVWKQDTQIALSDYIAFAHSLRRKAQCTLTFAALDVIAGSSSGPPPSEKDFEEASAEGWANYLIMAKENGIKCLPTFHQGDPFYWLEKMAHETDHIALSPRKIGKNPTQKIRWLNACFRKIDGWGLLSKLKTHGMGVASPTFMETYPFYSVDSTAWFEAVTAEPYAYVEFNGCDRVESLPPSEWGRNADLAYRNPKSGRSRMQDTSGVLAAIHYYRPAGNKETLTLKAGYPWFLTRSMEAYKQLEGYMTDLWLGRGVDWSDK